MYRAHDTTLGRDVAIKLLPPDLAADPASVARFAREARVLAALNHPYIATLFGLERITHDGGGQPGVALVMELVDGASLDTLVARGPLPLREAVRLGSQIAEAVEYAHDHGIIHRDLKPGNITVFAGRSAEGAGLRYCEGDAQCACPGP